MHESWTSIKVLKIDAHTMVINQPPGIAVELRVQIVRSFANLRLLKMKLWRISSDEPLRRPEDHPMYLSFKQMLGAIESRLIQLKEVDDSVRIPRLELVVD